MGVRTEKKVVPENVAETISDSVATFFFDFGTLVALGPRKGPAELLACLLLDAQAPPWWSNDLINRLKDCVLRLGDPNPNPWPKGLAGLPHSPEPGVPPHCQRLPLAAGGGQGDAPVGGPGDLQRGKAQTA